MKRKSSPPSSFSEETKITRTVEITLKDEANMQVESMYNSAGSITINRYEQASTSQSDEMEETGLDLLCSELQESLRNTGMEICGEKDRFRGDKIEIAPLQISKESRNLEAMKETGHHRRKDIVKIYSENTQKDICYTKLFEEALRHSIETSKDCSTEPAKKSHILRHSNIVFVAGHAGIGKTTFTKLLVKEILDPNIRLFESDYVFFLRFRDVDYAEKSDLLVFLTASASYFAANIPEEHRKKILKELQNSDKVCIVLDGLDEAIIDPKAKQPNCHALSVTTAEVFIKNLLSGAIFPRAKKLITSRPRQLARLPAAANESNFMVNILGLKDDGQKQICDDLCGDDKDRRDRILEYILSRPDLKSYCYVPINCILIMVSFNEMDAAEWRNVDSFSAILLIALEEWFLKKLEGQFQTREISSLAYEGFLSDKFYFLEIDLLEAKVNFQNTTTFLTNNIRFELLKGDKGKISYFCHLIWQEFFVAVELRLYISIGVFQDLVSQLDTDKFEVVTRFLYGLCNDAKLKELMNLLIDTKGLNSKEDRTKSKKILKDMAIKKLEQLRDNQVENYFTSILPALGWVYEMKDEGLRLQASKCLRNRIEVGGQVLPSDIPSFNYVLQSRETELILEIKIPSFIGNSFQYFIDILFNTLSQNKQIRVPKFELNGETIHDASGDIISKCIEKADDILLEDFNITEDGVAEVANKIANREFPMRSLCMSGLTVGDVGANHLAKSIHNINELFLDGCNITSQGVAVLTKETAKKRSSMVRLGLDSNPLDDSAAMSLSDVICKIDALRIRECNITSQGVIHLAEKIEKRSIPMTELYLSSNPMDDEGVKALSKCVDKIEELFLNECNVTEEGIAFLAQQIVKRNQPIKFLNLGSNPLNDSGVHALSKCVHNIEKLSLEACEITAEVVAALAGQIKLRSTPMKKLVLSENKFGDDGANALMDCLHNISELVVVECGISSAVAEKMKERASEVGVHVKVPESLDMSDENIINFLATLGIKI